MKTAIGRFFSSLGATLLAIVSIAFAHMATAQPLPPAACQTNGVGPLCGPNYDKSTILSVDPSYSGSISGTLTYDYEVTAPGQAQTIAVQAELYDLASASLNGSAQATSSIGTTPVNPSGNSTGVSPQLVVNGIVVTVVDNGGACSLLINDILQSTGCGTHTINSTLTIKTNTMYEISLYSAAALNGTGSALGYADPSITVDPTTCSGCAVEMSAGILNAVTPVPLPAAPWLMLSGLGALGFAARRPGSRKHD